MSWDELVATALLGTDRREIPAQAFDALDWPASTGDAAPALLDLAAAYTPYRRAGTLPVSLAAPEPVLGERLASAPAAAQHLLAELLDRRLLLAVEEWVQVCAASGSGVPPPLWPAVADLLAPPRAVDRSALRTAYGERGVTFLGLRKEWSWLLGGSAERVADALGRDQVAEQWEGASAKEKVDLLVAWQDVGPQDVPFLESALADRRSSVARAAGAQLARIPSSAYSQRMTQRALAWVRVEQHRLRKSTVHVDPPDQDESMVADGVPASPPASFGSGQRTWLLHNAVAAADLSAWESHTGLAPHDLVQLARDSEWFVALRAAWRIATVAQGDPTWAVALITSGDTDPQLVSLVSPDELNDVARSALRKGADLEQLAPALLTRSAPLPADLLQAMLKLVRSGRLLGDIEGLARRVPLSAVEAVADARQRGPEQGLTYPQAVEHALGVLHEAVAARAAVHQSFRTTPGRSA